MHDNEKNEIKQIIDRIGFDEVLNIIVEIKESKLPLKFKIPCVDCKENLQIMNQSKNSIFLTKCNECNNEYVVYAGVVRLARQSSVSGSLRRSVVIRSFDADEKSV